MMMSESWQDWRDPQFLAFLTAFYQRQLEIAGDIAHKWPDPYVIAVFEKVAPPAVYLKAEYDRWLHGSNEKTIIEQGAKLFTKPKVPIPSTPQPKATKDDRWQPTGKNPAIEWCKEQDATEKEMQDAMDPETKHTWYLPARNGYRYGSIFRRKEAKT
jgi:hypothetical protein